jgi:NADPH:quinone reductase-like Zn-dependent oxidoreductase
VFDTVGGEVFQRSLGVLGQGGIAVSMTGHVEESVARQQGVTAISQNTKVTTERLGKLAALVQDGVVTPQVAKVFSLDQVQEAFAFRESQSFTGKVVLKIS